MKIISLLKLHLCLLLVIWCALTTVQAFPVWEWCDDGPCDAGTYLDENTGQCWPCPTDTYVDQANHACLNCKQCSKVNIFEYEVMKTHCTRTSDTELGCVPGHFNTAGDHLHGLVCIVCSQCPENHVLVTQCETNFDTVCRDNNTVKPCDEESCKTGEFCNQKTRECQTCPSETNKDQDKHRHDPTSDFEKECLPKNSGAPVIVISYLVFVYIIY